MTDTKYYSELVKKALELLQDDEIFVEAVDELDSWNGFADGYRVFSMDELDELYYDCKATKLLNDICWGEFDLRDNYFADTIYGLVSLDDKAAYYRDHTTPEEVFDELKENYYHLSLNSDLEEIFDELDNYSEDEEESEE